MAEKNEYMHRNWTPEARARSILRLNQQSVTSIRSWLLLYFSSYSKPPLNTDTNLVTANITATISTLADPELSPSIAQHQTLICSPPKHHPHIRTAAKQLHHANRSRYCTYAMPLDRSRYSARNRIEARQASSSENLSHPTSTQYILRTMIPPLRN